MPAYKYSIDSFFKEKALLWASSFNHFLVLNCNASEQKFSSFPSTIAVDALDIIKFEEGKGFNRLKEYYNKNKSWLFGYFGYDLKNEIENLSSSNRDNLKLSDINFFYPRYILHFENNKVEIITEENSDNIFNKINSLNISYIPSKNKNISIKQRVNKEQYLKNIAEIKNHLLEGDIYELNYCMEFYSENSTIDPLHIFLKLNSLSPMPFSVFMRMNNDYLISASPERFLKKEKNKLLSQPIKGTCKRGNSKEEDEVLKNKLLNSEKERAENMMIVDLVRNDLAKSSKPGSVKVDELFGIYSYNQVHQMVSTVSSEIRDNIHFIDAIKNAFPMGSMTGTPKIKAMELIEKFESSKRGLFSGAVGFINPEGDFDFNVVIRSIIYSSEKNYISFHVGSAITYDSDPEKEYEECMIKAEAMYKALEEK